MADITQRIKMVLTPSIQALGFELWGVVYVQQGRSSILRIFIDGPSGVSIDDCAHVSRQCSSVLDVEDVIHNAYTLEVSTPGIDRQFFEPAQYSRFIGQKLKVKLYQALNQRKQLVGVLLSANEESITLEFDGQPVVVAFGDIDRANILI